MEIDILSLFPEYFKGPFDVSIIKRAIENELVKIRLIDIRDYSKNKHRKVDDRPFGGGPGMILSPQPVCDAIRDVKGENSYVIYLSPQGRKFDGNKARKLAKYKHLILLCGHYEGIDERIIKKEVDEEISIGDYILTNGCLPAIVVIDATLRFVPGVLGHPEAAEKDSFSEGFLEGPQYTRPENWEGELVPPVLMNGNHAEIEKYRLEMGMRKTKIVRPDLFEAAINKIDCD
jgi:tRNA (guanine37-N1)-methyltransferase